MVLNMEFKEYCEYEKNIKYLKKNLNYDCLNAMNNFTKTCDNEIFEITNYKHKIKGDIWNGYIKYILYALLLMQIISFFYLLFHLLGVI